MKRSFRIVLATMMLAVTTLLLVACGGKNSTEGKIVFWHRMGEANEALLKEMIKDFNKKYPDIEILAVKKAKDYNELQKAVNTAIPAGEAPHMVESYGDHVAGYMRSNSALALNDYINSKEDDGAGGIVGLTQAEIDDFVDSYWDEGKMYDNKGTIYSLAFSKSTEAMFYNKTFFEANELEVPKTWAELEAVAKQIKNMDKYKNDDMVIPVGYDSTDNLYITASYQQNIPYTTTTGQILFNNAEAKAMVNYFKGLYDQKLFATKASLGNANTSTRFVTQQLFMSIGSTGGTRYNIPEGSEANTFEVGVAPLPQFDLDNKKQVQQGPNINLFKKADKEEEKAAWLFLKFLTSPEQSAKFSIATGYSPVRKSSYDTKTYQDFIATAPTNPKNKTEAEQKAIIAVLEMANANRDTFFTTPVFSKSSKVRQEVGAIFQYVFSGQNIDTVFKRAYDEASF